MMNNKTCYMKGLQDGVPIFLGYLAVSFTLGIAAKKVGFTPFQATIMSLTNNTSAGQFAALGLITSGATYLEMAITQLVINLRYFLMSCSLSQKVDAKASFFHRLLIGFNVTDEVFGLSIGVDGYLNPAYTYGLSTMSIPGWALGTCLGTISGNVLPPRVLSAMGVALYGMFIAVIIPPAKKSRVLAGIIVVSMVASFLVSYVPGIRDISLGFRIIILTVVIAGLAAVLFPIPINATKENPYAA
ncbi:MAG: AzlC family ABC transporter permease [Bacillota bacterium]